MASALLRTESTSSSQIENLTVGAKQLALAQVGNSSSSNAEMVIGNVRAMEAALTVDGRADSGTIRLLHQRLTDEVPGGENSAGNFRDQLLWVGSSAASPLGASHPALTASALAQLAGLTPQSAVRTLGQLADAGVLAERTRQRRNRVWVHEGILRALDQYADQLRR